MWDDFGLHFFWPSAASKTLIVAPDSKSLCTTLLQYYANKKFTQKDPEILRQTMLCTPYLAGCHAHTVSKAKFTGRLIPWTSVVDNCQTCDWGIVFQSSNNKTIWQPRHLHKSTMRVKFSIYDTINVFQFQLTTIYKDGLCWNMTQLFCNTDFGLQIWLHSSLSGSYDLPHGPFRPYHHRPV